MTQRARDWSLANVKRDREPRCRVCKRRAEIRFIWERDSVSRPIELAHIIGREHDQNELDGTRQNVRAWIVFPERVVPLCGPATDPTSCHGKYDTRRLDLLGHLTPQEEAQAVIDAPGLERARIRLCPSEYRRIAA